jgi:hypothetical protein
VVVESVKVSAIEYVASQSGDVGRSGGEERVALGRRGPQGARRGDGALLAIAAIFTGLAGVIAVCVALVVIAASTARG